MPGVTTQREAFQEMTMAGHTIPHFQNDAGHPVVTIGVKEFMCVGATEPFDHPHVFLDMGDDVEKVCPYCSTHFVYNSKLTSGLADPISAIYTPETA